MKKHLPIFLLFIVCCFSCKKVSNKDLEISLITLSNTELQQKTTEELRLLRNAVFARKGYMFQSEDLNIYFKTQAWYTPNPNVEVALTEEEKAYVENIKKIEAKLKEEKIEIIKTTSKKTIAYEGVKDTAYVYQDNKGKYDLLLTKVENSKAIYAYCNKKDSLETKLLWKLRDFAEGEETDENEITFIKDFMSVTDIDGDGLAEPILVYVFEKNHSFEEGKLKIIIRYKNAKIAIRHKNAASETERETQIDEGFYNLPTSIKTKVKSIMTNLAENEYAVFNEDVLNSL